MDNIKACKSCVYYRASYTMRTARYSYEYTEENQCIKNVHFERDILTGKRFAVRGSTYDLPFAQQNRCQGDWYEPRPTVISGIKEIIALAKPKPKPKPVEPTKSSGCEFTFEWVKVKGKLTVVVDKEKLGDPDYDPMTEVRAKFGDLS